MVRIMGVLMPFSTIFQVYRGCFIVGGNRSVKRKPLTCLKSMANLYL